MKEGLRHPRPQFLRDDWQLLDGQWEFEFDDNNNGVLRGLPLGNIKLNQTIKVPFSYQYKDSGIGDETTHDNVWYRKEIDLKQINGSLILNFNASMYETDVWFNGYHVIKHIGGYSPFSEDVSKYAKVGKNVIVIRCFSPLDPTLPRGKQSWTGERFSCWYIPNTGLWQSVWFDYSGYDYLQDYSITPDIDSNSFYGEVQSKYGKANKMLIVVKYDNKVVHEESISLKGKYARYRVKLMESNYVDEVTYWAPEHPNLHYVDFLLYQDDVLLDTVHTRFGMRKISISEDGKILLNNKHIYQRLILDQGYWKDSGYTAPSIDALKQDIILTKKMGFNGARKHQKIENPYFYYFADELGFLVWCEMPSAYNFNNDEVKNLTSQWIEVLNNVSKFSSIITYVLLNESWGVRKVLNDATQQSLAKSLYYITKSIDCSRLVSTNDGWENLSESDIICIHDYSPNGEDFKERYAPEVINDAFQTFRKVMAENAIYKNQPLLLSEFGGISLKSAMKEGCWGYNDAAKDEDELLIRLDKLLTKIKESKFQGFCYTQLTDVQQEVNGLLDSDHKPKMDIQKLKKIFEK